MSGPMLAAEFLEDLTMGYGPAYHRSIILKAYSRLRGNPIRRVLRMLWLETSSNSTRSFPLHLMEPINLVYGEISAVGWCIPMENSRRVVQRPAGVIQPPAEVVKSTLRVV